jgi:FAD-dependent sensor of blue light
MSLVRLAYISASLLADDPNARRQVADILLTSRRNNDESEVTGVLLATDHNFFQVLEGERQAVEAAYARIARDPRHKDIVLTLYESIEVRRFPDWAMAYIGPSHSAEQAMARVTSRVPACKTGQAARALVTFMSQMLAEQSRADALVPAAE